MSKPRNAPLWVKVLVLFHVVAITSWSLPQSPHAVQAGEKKAEWREMGLYVNDVYLRFSPIRQYLMTTGMWQSWDMFSPNPANADLWGDAVITYQDGSTKLYRYPRMKELPIAEKYVKERYRKFFERVGNGTQTFLQKRFAERIARLNPGVSGNRPVKIVLRKHVRKTPRNMPFGTYWSQLFGSIGAGKFSMSSVLPPNPSMPDYETTEFDNYTFDPAEVEQLVKGG